VIVSFYFLIYFSSVNILVDAVCLYTVADGEMG